MSYVSERKVKGKKYYYLEESLRHGSKLIKESIYLGPMSPSNEVLLNAFEKLKQECAKKNHQILVPPLTEFISSRTAGILEGAKKKSARLLYSFTTKQKQEFLQRQRLTFITESNAIEGSSLGYEETKSILGKKKRIEELQKKRAVVTGLQREEQEAMNHENCMELYDKMLAKNEKISHEMILRLHYALLRDISGYEKYQGIYRPVQVYVSGSTHEFPTPQEVNGLMSLLINWLHEKENLIHPVELAAKFHTKFTSIHPFADGNGRMARLLMNYILQQKKFPFTNIPLKRRSVYMKTQSAGNKEDFKPFTKFLTEEVVKQNLGK